MYTVIPHSSAVISSLLLFLLCAPAGTSAQTALEPENTFAVITGALNWPYSSLGSYSKVNRRDKGLYDTLIKRGVPAKNMKLLLDADATETNMIMALDDVAALATTNATMIFYYAGHGYTGTEGVYFASYDVGATNGPKEGFLLRNVSRILKERYKGRRVLLMADCCYSGGLCDEAELLAESGFETASLTSASIANSSGGDWILSCAIIDMLNGRSLCDRDGDGYISLREAGEEIRDAINFFGEQDHGFALHNIDASFRIAKVESADQPVTIPAPYKLGEYVRHKKHERPVRIIGVKNDKLHLEQQRYHDRKYFYAKPDDIVSIERPVFPPVTGSTLRDPAGTLSEEDARTKATAGGKYSVLLKTVPARYDHLSYGMFSDYGRSSEREYLGFLDLPPGFWVYVYPNWYIFEQSASPAK